MAESIQKAMEDEGSFANPLELSIPILVNNELLSELSWSADNVSVDLYCEAANRATSKLKPSVMELDYSLHLWMGFALIIAANPQITFDDLKMGIKGTDVLKITMLGRFFITRAAGPADESSDEPSDGTPGDSLPQS